MNPKIRALVWEQLRVAGIVSLWCFIVASLLHLVLSLNFWMVVLSDYAKLHYLLFYSTGILLLFRQNTSGHLVTHFERRLARLPLNNTALAFIPLAIRCACYTAYGTGLAVILRLQLGYFEPVCMILFPVAVYALVQSAVWSGSTFPWLVLATASVAGWVLFELWISQYVYVEALVDGSLRPIEDAVLVLLLGYLFAAAFGLSLLGIRWQRARNMPNLSALSDAFTRDTRHRERPRPDFLSPLDARVWFEQHAGQARPVKVFIAAVMLAAPLALLVYLLRAWIYGIPSRSYFSFFVPADALRWLPCLVVVFGAGVVGLFRDFSRTLWPISLTTFTHTKPLDAASLAWAHLLAMTRMIAVALLVVFILSNAAYALLFPGEVQVMLEVTRISGWFRPLIFYVEPLFWACILSWLALTCLRPIALGGIAFVTLGTLASLVLDSVRTPYYSDPIVFVTFYGLCGLVILRSILLTYRTWNAQVLNGSFCIAFLVGHIAATLFIWWPGPRNVPEALHSFSLTFVFVTLLLSPLVALPYRIARKRIIL